MSYDEEFGQGRSHRQVRDSWRILEVSWKVFLVALAGLAIISFLQDCFR